MKFYIFSSGSKGNATLLIDKTTHILIDLGISKRQLIEHLHKINLELDDIDLILLTHDHSDHTKGLENINNIPIYGSKNTYMCNNYHVIEPYIPFKERNLFILPIQVSHDARNPIGFIFSNDKEKLVYVTDTGYINEKNMQLMKDANYYIFESNHDKKMLLNTRRPAALKERIMSEFGHLSNEDCALYLSHLIGAHTSQIYLAHISMEANTYELAKEVCIKELKRYHIDVNRLKIESAKQYESVEGGYEN